MGQPRACSYTLEITTGLTSIFNQYMDVIVFTVQFIDESVFPDDFMFAQANDPFDQNNYTPISILSVLSKVLEGIMKN